MLSELKQLGGTPSRTGMSRLDTRKFSERIDRGMLKEGLKEATREEIRVFRKLVPGYNFMTPEIMGIFRIAEFLVEFSAGEGIFGGPLYGMTVVEITLEGPRKRSELGGGFTNLEELDGAIQKLRGIE